MSQKRRKFFVCEKCGLENLTELDYCIACKTPIPRADDHAPAPAPPAQPQAPPVPQSPPPPRFQTPAPRPAPAPAVVARSAVLSYCQACSAPVEPGWSFCDQCGRPLGDAQPGSGPPPQIQPPPEPSRPASPPVRGRAAVVPPQLQHQLQQPVPPGPATDAGPPTRTGKIMGTTCLVLFIVAVVAVVVVFFVVQNIGRSVGEKVGESIASPLDIGQ